jgi:hypothetical protein
MTRRTNATIAGLTYLLYIAAAFPAMVLFKKATSGDGISAILAVVAQHAAEVRLVAVLSLVSCFCALVLAVTLYGITRDEDRDLAMLGMTFRLGEGVLSGMSMVATVGLLWVATATGGNAPNTDGAQALGAFLLKAGDWTTIIAATFFAVGSTLFCWLLLRGRMIPVALAWIGVLGSGLLVVFLPLRLIGFFAAPVFELVWLPVGVFEVVAAPWLIIKGVREPAMNLNGHREQPASTRLQ